MKKIIIFLNGEFKYSFFKIQIDETEITPFHVSEENDLTTPIYVADGGLNYFVKHKFPIHNLFWTGDGDSLNKKSKEFLQKWNSSFTEDNLRENKIIILNPKKDLSDLASLLDKILSTTIKESLFIEIYGGLGKRRDHEHANKEEVAQFIALLPKGGVAFFHGGVVITSIPIKFLETRCEIFSIFDTKGFVEIKGAQYSGQFSLQRPSHGLSNKITDKILSVTPFGGVSTLYFEE